MSSIRLLIPDSTLLALRKNAEDAGKQLLLAAAVKLYEAGTLSSGAAAELAGLNKTVFLSQLGAYGAVTFRQDAAELEEELQNA